MELSSSTLAASVRNDVVHLEGVTKFAPNRRFATVFTEGSTADSLYYLDSGLVKLYKRGEDSKEIILDIVAPGELFGEQALLQNTTRNVSAELLQEGVLFVIPNEVFLNFCETHSPLWRQTSELLLSRQEKLQKKIELLCLKDVEFRILYYLNDLAGVIGVKLNAHEFSIPLSQGELASLIGATRETTSTTLNALARRGLIRLGRRQLIVISPEDVRSVAEETSTHAAGH